MKTNLQDIIVTVFGAISSLLTAIILAWIGFRWNVSVYSYMVWFLIPIGAIVSGFVAAGGYYLGALLFNHKPNKILLLNMVAISIGTYLLIQFFDYSYLEIEGKRVSDYLSFWEYWDLSTAHQKVQLMQRGVKFGSPIELGDWAYVYAVLQIVGFAIGGFLTYTYLNSLVYCDKCSKYFLNKGSAVRYMKDRDKFLVFLEEVAELVKDQKLAQIISLQSVDGGEKKYNRKTHYLMTEVQVKKCKVCGTNFFRFNVKKRNGSDSWEIIKELSFCSFSGADLSLSN